MWHSCNKYLANKTKVWRLFCNLNGKVNKYDNRSILRPGPKYGEKAEPEEPSRAIWWEVGYVWEWLNKRFDPAGFQYSLFFFNFFFLLLQNPFPYFALFFFFPTLTNSTCSWREVQVTVPPTLFCPHGSGRKWPKSRLITCPHTFTHAYPTSPSCFFIKEFTFSLL